MARSDRSRDCSGQAAVELALTMPLLTVFLLLILQLALLGRDAVLVSHAAREAAREAAVTARADRIQEAGRAAGGLRPSRLTVRPGPRGAPGTRTTVAVSYRSPTEVPLIGRMVPDVTFRASATTRVEM